MGSFDIDRTDELQTEIDNLQFQLSELADKYNDLFDSYINLHDQHQSLVGSLNKHLLNHGGSTNDKN